MEVLVVGGTGTVGSEVVRLLLERGVNVRVMARSADSLKRLPRGARGVAADLAEPDSLGAAFEGVDRAFLITALSPEETKHGLAAVRAAREAGVGRAVYQSVAMPEGSLHIPHFASKVPIERELQRSGMEWTILRPNNVFQNDLRFREAIVQHGVYPQPIGSKGMNGVDVRDIAEVAVKTLTEQGHAGEIYPLNGPDALTGKSMAETYSRHLGREVRYGGDDLDVWERQARAAMPEWLVRDLRIMYEFFQARGFGASEEDFAKQGSVLGHRPRSHDAFVAEVAPGWRS